jgi:hypothetical protein
MRSRLPSTLFLVLVVVVGVVSSVGGAPAAAAAFGGEGEGTPPQPRVDVPAQAQTGTATEDLQDGSVIELRLRTDGDARWRISHRFVLDDERDRRTFESLAGEFEAGDLGSGELSAYRQASEAAGAYTGREMGIRNVSRTSEVVRTGEPNTSVGVLRLSFVWTGFSRVQGATVQVDDAFRTGPNSTWFPGITAGETFVVRPPPGYGVDTAPTGSRDGVLRWEGPETFEPGELEIRYRQLATGTESEGPGGPGDGNDRSLLVFGSLFGVAVLALAVFVFSRRGTPWDDADVDDGGAGARAGAAAETEGEDESGTGGAMAGSTGVNGEDAPIDGTDEPDVDTELLSDEERVEYLLERNGGRMKQANIVKETGWSNAKVSQLLSGMDEADRVDKLRIGRENLISLPDHDVTEFEE